MRGLRRTRFDCWDWAEKATGTSGASVWKLYLFAGGHLIGQRIEGATTTTTSYFINDHLDSLAVITDEMGAVKECLAYDPWGKRRYTDGSDAPTWSITLESNAASPATSRWMRGAR
ncbi:MAG: hypothetical protein ACJAVO_002647 [Parvibaculaceae bacterium]